MDIKSHITALRNWNSVTAFWHRNRHKSRYKQTSKAQAIHGLQLRTGDAIKLLRMADAQAGLTALDCVYADWKVLGRKDWMAKIRFVLMEHYQQSGQPQIAWQTFEHNAGLFDSTGLASSSAFATVLHQSCHQLGKTSETQLLDNWLAMLEDIELETDVARRAANREWFEDYQTSVGGLSGLLRVCH